MSARWRIKNMAASKPHREFFAIDEERGWETPKGYPSGFKHRILSSDIDEKRKTGSRSRLMRIAPGTYTTVPFVHDHWEEVYLIEGDLTVGNDENGKGGERFFAPTYACRPPGAYHGPFKSENGCVMFELHYYTDETETA